MPETVLPGPISNANGVTEAVSINTGKVYDSCRDKDCIEDLRVYLTPESQALVDQALSLKNAMAELLYVYIDVESAPFNRGFYTVDATYFYRVTANAYSGCPRPCHVEGLAIYEKRAILFGSEGNTKTFSSKTVTGGLDHQLVVRNNMPVAVVEAVDPIVLSMRMEDACDVPRQDFRPEVPRFLMEFFSGDLSFQSSGRRLFVTLGQFSVMRLERDAQLLVPCFNYCLPEKQCDNSCSDATPCDLFDCIAFPVNDFCPPSCFDGPGSKPCPCRCE